MLNTSNKMVCKATLCAGLGSAILVYYTIKQYLKRRKYSHIPGPKTRGLI